MYTNKYNQVIKPKAVTFEFSELELSLLLEDMITKKYNVTTKIHVGRNNIGQLTIGFYNGFHGQNLSKEFYNKLEEDYKDSPFYGHEDFTKNIMNELFNSEKISIYIPYDVDSPFYKISVDIPFDHFKNE